MSIQTKKLHFIQEILKLKDENLIDKLYELLRTEKKRHDQSDIAPMSLEEFDEMIKTAESEVENGKFVSAEKLLKSIEQWR